MSDNKVTMYGAEWCGDCRRSKKFLDSNNVNYTYVDVEHDEAGKDKAISISGKQSIPVIAFNDGTFLVEPSDINLKKKLEEISVL
jgi:mycoredoxin